METVTVRGIGKVQFDDMDGLLRPMSAPASKRLGLKPSLRPGMAGYDKARTARIGIVKAINDRRDENGQRRISWAWQAHDGAYWGKDYL